MNLDCNFMALYVVALEIYTYIYIFTHIIYYFDARQRLSLIACQCRLHIYLRGNSYFSPTLLQVALSF